MANPHVGLVDARLNLLALLEGLVRAGALSSCSFISFSACVFDRVVPIPPKPHHVSINPSTAKQIERSNNVCFDVKYFSFLVGLMNWECSGYIATASEDIIRHMIVPNLVWRVGE